MKHRCLLLASVLLFSFTISVSAAEKKKEFKIPFEKYSLANGLDVVLHVDRSDPIAAVYVVYHVGSSREIKGKTGFAHLFEHIMFQESQHVGQDQFFKKIQSAGGSLNGSTNTDRTNYFVTVPKNALEMSLWLEADRMGFLLSKLTQESFENQQNVVQNEKRQNYDNQPYGQASYAMSKLLYPENHPYNWQVIGSLDDLCNATLQDVIEFYKKYYLPNNATIVVAGDIDVAQTKKWIEKYFGEIKSSVEPGVLPKMPVLLTETKKAYFEDNLANAPDFSMAFPTVEQYNKDAYALSYLAQLLSGSKKSPLYKVIVEEKKLAPQVMAFQRSLELAGSFAINIRTFPDKNLGDVEDAVKEAFQRFEKDGFTDKDLERLKTGVEVGFYNTIASVLGKAMRLGDYNEFAGSPDFINTDLNNSLSVTQEDIWRVYNKYIKDKHYVLLNIVPKGKTNLAAANANLFVVPEESIDKQGNKKEAAQIKTELIPTKFDRSKEPTKGSDPVVKIPNIWTDKTKKGIPIYGIKQSELPLVNFQIILKGGMILDNAGKIGTAHLTARMINEGTKTKTPVELREAIQDLGATINVSAGIETITLTGTCLTNKLSETAALAKEILFEPRWDEKEFALVKSQTIETLKRSESSPVSIASSVYNKLIYGADNILSNSPMGTVKSIESISIDDLKNYYYNNFSASVVKIMVVGDITKENAVAVFNKLNNWESKEVIFPKVASANSAKPGVYFVDVPKAKQSEFRVGHLSLPYTSPDYYKTVVMNHRLGGDFNGILNMILREEKGFTYGARSSFSASAYSGAFTASTGVQSNATLETAQIIKNEINKYKESISKNDLNDVKSTLLKGNALRFETLMALGQMLLPVVIYNLPFDYVKQRESFVQKITADEHKALSQKYLQPDKMIYLIIGDKETQFDNLNKLDLGAPILIDKEAKPVN